MAARNRAEPPDAQGDSAVHSPYEYFRRIESLFIRLRGAPLQLAPAEYHVAKRWQQMGIPLRLIEEKLSELFAEKLEQEDTERSVRPFKFYSLRYWRPVIEAAWKEEAAIMAPAAAAESASLDVPARLARLADAMPTTVRDRMHWQEQIRGLTGDVESVEEALGRLDEALVAAVEPTPALRKQLDHRLARALDRLGDRLTEDELAAAKARLGAQLTRELLGLPVLSLFGPEAQ